MSQDLSFANGQFGFNFTGPAGQMVIIEASPNLQTWTSLQTNTLGASPVYFSDPESPGLVQPVLPPPAGALNAGSLPSCWGVDLGSQAVTESVGETPADATGTVALPIFNGIRLWLPGALGEGVDPPFDVGGLGGVHDLDDLFPRGLGIGADGQVDLRILGRTGRKLLLQLAQVTGRGSSTDTVPACQSSPRGWLPKRLVSLVWIRAAPASRPAVA